MSCFSSSQQFPCQTEHSQKEIWSFYCKTQTNAEIRYSRAFPCTDLNIGNAFVITCSGELLHIVLNTGSAFGGDIREHSHVLIWTSLLVKDIQNSHILFWTLAVLLEEIFMSISTYCIEQWQWFWCVRYSWAFSCIVLNSLWCHWTLTLW